MHETAVSIIKTLAFFDLFGIPLTAAEVFSHAYNAGSEISYRQIRSELQHLTASGKIKRHEAFYLLPDRTETFVSDYKLRQAQTFEMIRHAQPWFARLASWPHARAIAICNSLAFLNANKDSDIDLFVLVEPNKLWSTRFALVSLLHLLRKRPTTANHAGKICLSFFINAQKSDITGLSITDNDVYLQYWAKTLLPVHQSTNAFAAFYDANRALWQPVARAMPQMKPLYASSRHYPLTKVLFKLAAVFLDVVAGPIKRWQEKRFPAEIKNAAGKGSGVVMSDDMLKFHAHDRREEYRQAWIKRYSECI